MVDNVVNGLAISGGLIANNGQNTSYTAIQRGGITMQGAEVKRQIIMVGAAILDTQSYTKTLGASYVPGTTDSNNRYAFTLLTAGLVGLGERITLVNVISGPANATGTVVDIDKDELTVEFGSALTFVDNVSSGTGTISSSGTAVTGSGTLFVTELIGRAWIKAGGEYRQVMRVISDTSCTVSSAFGSSLSGATYQRVRSNVVGIQSQQHGVYWDANTTDLDVGSNVYEGNVVSDIHGEGSLNSFPGAIRAGAAVTLFQTGTFAASTTTNISPAVPAGYEIVGYRFHILTDVTGTTGATIGLSLAGGSSQAFTAGLGVTANTKNSGNVVPERLTAATQLRATFSGGADNVPDGGTYRAEIRVRRASFVAFLSV